MKASKPAVTKENKPALVKENKPTVAKENKPASPRSTGDPQKTIKEGIINGFQIINQIEAGFVDLARNTVSDTIRATGNVTNEAVSVVERCSQGDCRGRAGSRLRTA